MSANIKHYATEEEREAVKVFPDQISMSEDIPEYHSIEEAMEDAVKKPTNTGPNFFDLKEETRKIKETIKINYTEESIKESSIEQYTKEYKFVHDLSNEEKIGMLRNIDVNLIFETLMELHKEIDDAMYNSGMCKYNEWENNHNKIYIELQETYNACRQQIDDHLTVFRNFLQS